MQSKSKQPVIFDESITKFLTLEQFKSIAK